MKSSLEKLTNVLKGFLGIEELIITKADIKNENYIRLLMKDKTYFVYASKDTEYKKLYNAKPIIELFLDKELKINEISDKVNCCQYAIDGMLRNLKNCDISEDEEEFKGFKFLNDKYKYAIIKDGRVTYNSGLEDKSLESSLMKLRVNREFHISIETGELFALRTKHYQIVLESNRSIEEFLKKVIKIRIVTMNEVYENEVYIKENDKYLHDLLNINFKLEELVGERTVELIEKNKLLKEEKNKLNEANFQLTNLNKKLEILSRQDPLTKLPNRRELLDKFRNEIHNLKLKRKSITIIIADIDHFKKINDLYGHACGDYVLVEVPKIFRKVLREDGVISRYGGEEYVILLPDADINYSEFIAEELRVTLEKTLLNYNGNEFKVTASFGVYNFDDELNFINCIEKADIALYDAKNSGRNKVVVYSNN